MPVLIGRSIPEFPIANLTICDHQNAIGGIHHHPHAWLDPLEVNKLDPAGPTTLVDSGGNALAWHGEQADPNRSVAAERSFLIKHSWDLLRANESHLEMVTSDLIEGEVHPHAVIEGHLHLGKGSRLLPGVFIEGKVVIGPNCKIGPNCYIRGNTSIGSDCFIGQSVEIKNSIILSHSRVCHLSYVGDSIIGENANLGAGTITSNFRHDGENHRTMVDGRLMDTGRQKFGSIIGDRVHTGIHTSIYPGRKLFPGSSTRPGEVIAKDIQ